MASENTSILRLDLAGTESEKQAWIRFVRSRICPPPSFFESDDFETKQKVWLHMQICPICKQYAFAGQKPEEEPTEPALQSDKGTGAEIQAGSVVNIRADHARWLEGPLYHRSFPVVVLGFESYEDSQQEWVRVASINNEPSLDDGSLIHVQGIGSVRPGTVETLYPQSLEDHELARVSDQVVNKILLDGLKDEPQELQPTFQSHAQSLDWLAMQAMHRLSMARYAEDEALRHFYETMEELEQPDAELDEFVGLRGGQAEEPHSQGERKNPGSPDIVRLDLLGSQEEKEAWLSFVRERVCPPEEVASSSNASTKGWLWKHSTLCPACKAYGLASQPSQLEQSLANRGEEGLDLGSVVWISPDHGGWAENSLYYRPFPVAILGFEIDGQTGAQLAYVTKLHTVQALADQYSIHADGLGFLQAWNIRPICLDSLQPLSVGQVQDRARKALMTQSLYVDPGTVGLSPTVRHWVRVLECASLDFMVQQSFARFNPRGSIPDYYEPDEGPGPGD
jgi:hypothetical protein